MFPLDSTPEQIAAIKKQVCDLGLTISAHGVNGLSKNDDANRKVFEFAKAAGIRNITADPDPDSFDSIEKLSKSLISESLFITTDQRTATTKPSSLARR